MPFGHLGLQAVDSLCRGLAREESECKAALSLRAQEHLHVSRGFVSKNAMQIMVSGDWNVVQARGCAGVLRSCRFLVSSVCLIWA